MNDAIFLANVWKLIREKGLDYILAFGDPDGIDFVANRVLTAGQAVAADGTCAHEWNGSAQDNTLICVLCGAETPRR